MGIFRQSSFWHFDFCFRLSSFHVCSVRWLCVCADFYCFFFLICSSLVFIAFLRFVIGRLVYGKGNDRKHLSDYMKNCITRQRANTAIRFCTAIFEYKSPEHICMSLWLYAAASIHYSLCDLFLNLLLSSHCLLLSNTKQTKRQHHLFGLIHTVLAERYKTLATARDSEFGYIVYLCLCCQWCESAP